METRLSTTGIIMGGTLGIKKLLIDTVHQSREPLFKVIKTQSNSILSDAQEEEVEYLERICFAFPLVKLYKKVQEKGRWHLVASNYW
jgi:hypothetical protein